MQDHSITTRGDTGPLPADDPARALVVAEPGDADLPIISVVGDTYTILVSGRQTAGRYCLIDMLVPDGGGPPPHRHDFEEMFTLLEGELEFTCRGQTRLVAAPATVNVPANAPHQFKNVSGKQVHMLCLCAPAGQEEFFLEIGVPMRSRDDAPPKLSREEQAAKGELAKRLAPKYRTEMAGSA